MNSFRIKFPFSCYNVAIVSCSSLTVALNYQVKVLVIDFVKGTINYQICLQNQTKTIAPKMYIFRLDLKNYRYLKTIIKDPYV